MDSKLAKIDKLKEDMFLKVQDFNPAELELQEVTVRLGGKTCKLVVVEDVPIPGEKEVREELVLKIKDRLKAIQDYLHQKMVEMTSTIESVKDEYTRKEQVLEDRLHNAAPMPEVRWEHAVKGVTITKGNGGELIWYVRGLYWPKKYNEREIEFAFSNKLMTPIIFVIKTRGNQVLSVHVTRVQDLQAFQHYHMMTSNTDCWGYWNHPVTWNNPDDIINIARQAEAVLEKINGDSIAQSNPRGLPMIATLKNHLMPARTTTPKVDTKVTPEMRRQGFDTPVTGGDVWSVDEPAF